MNMKQSSIHNLTSDTEIKVYHLEKNTFSSLQKYYRKEANHYIIFYE